MSQAHPRQLYAALTQRGWKVVEHQRSDEVVEVRGAAAWEIRRHDEGPTLLLDFAGFGGTGEDIPLDQSYACQLRGHSIGHYFSRVNRSRETWLKDLNEFVHALESALGQ